MNNYQIGAGGYNNYDAGVTSQDVIESYEDEGKYKIILHRKKKKSQTKQK